MAAKVKRTKTKHTGIYFNENTHKYDIKYNYKIYNPDTHKNDYKQKWKSGFATVKDAKSGILKLQYSIPAIEAESITLQGALTSYGCQRQKPRIFHRHQSKIQPAI